MKCNEESAGFRQQLASALGKKRTRTAALSVRKRFGLALCLLTVTSGCRELARTSEGLSSEQLPCARQIGELWESAPWTSNDPACYWHRFAGGVTLTVPHSLGRVPILVVPYLSFAPDPGESGADSAIGSGDLARVVHLSDVDVALENSTKEAFYLRLVLQ